MVATSGAVIVDGMVYIGSRKEIHDDNQVETLGVSGCG